MYRYVVTKKEAKRRAELVFESKKRRKQLDEIKRANDEFIKKEEKRILDDVNAHYRMLRYYIQQDNEVEEHLQKGSNPIIHVGRERFFLNERYLTETTRKFIREILNDPRPLDIDLVTGLLIENRNRSIWPTRALSETEVLTEMVAETEAAERERGIRLEMAETVIADLDDFDYFA